jgi:hypothetical protein
MKAYRIESKAGVDMGVFSGETPEDAVRAMIKDGGGEYGSESAGTVDDYYVSGIDVPDSVSLPETTEEVHAAARVLGRKGGQSRSERKQAASRNNGRQGGRPRKKQ